MPEQLGEPGLNERALAVVQRDAAVPVHGVGDPREAGIGNNFHFDRHGGLEFGAPEQGVARPPRPWKALKRGSTPGIERLRSC